VIVFGEGTSSEILSEYATYYNHLRTQSRLKPRCLDPPGNQAHPPPSHHDLCSAAYITNIAGFEFSAHTAN
jgi:hypothetical protein